MNGKHYEVRFLPLFEDDLSEIVDYIADRLQNPIAADALIDAVETAIEERRSCAESFEPYRSVREHRYPYYRIYVKNFVIYYVVMGDVMEVRRIFRDRCPRSDTRDGTFRGACRVG